MGGLTGRFVFRVKGAMRERRAIHREMECGAWGARVCVGEYVGLL